MHEDLLVRDMLNYVRRSVWLRSSDYFKEEGGVASPAIRSCHLNHVDAVALRRSIKGPVLVTVLQPFWQSGFIHINFEFVSVRVHKGVLGDLVLPEQAQINLEIFNLPLNDWVEVLFHLDGKGLGYTPVL